MLLRYLRSGDVPEIQSILEKSGFEYAMPDLEDWRFNPVIVGEEAGRVAMAAGLRLTSEAYLWVNKELGDPRTRWAWLLEMHEAVRREAARIGYQDVHAFLPPQLPRAFVRRLQGLGWRRETFEPWWRSVSE